MKITNKILFKPLGYPANTQFDNLVGFKVGVKSYIA